MNRATALAAHDSTARPLGVDYSRSLFARPLFARLFGVLAIVVGSAFLLGALTSS